MVKNVVRARKPSRVATEGHTETITSNTDRCVKASLKARGLVALKNRDTVGGIVDGDPSREDREDLSRMMLSNGDPIDEERAIRHPCFPCPKSKKVSK